MTSILSELLIGEGCGAVCAVDHGATTLAAGYNLEAGENIPSTQRNIRAREWPQPKFGNLPV
jgi:hypothetical protein